MSAEAGRGGGDRGETSSTGDAGGVLIAGAGPTAVQIAVLTGRGGARAGVVGRESSRSRGFYEAVEAHGGIVSVDVQNRRHHRLAGQCQLARWFRQPGRVTGCWPTLVLTVTADAHLPVLARMTDDALRSVEHVVLLSPTLGPSVLVREHLRRRGCGAEVISLSSHLSDTRWPDGSPGAAVLTAGVKKRICAGSTLAGSPAVQQLRRLHLDVGVDVEVCGLPVEAGSRNISFYVHPPLLMDETTLAAVFGTPAPGGTGAPTRYVSELFPEGPITPALVRVMVAQWPELTAVVTALGGTGVNLLRLVLEDSYPVRPESLGAAETAAFVDLPVIHQEHLVHVRYASLLIDPFSEPDEDGRYFDFSGIPVHPVLRGSAGEWDVPRMPKEDHYRTKIVQGLARHLAVACPTIDALLSLHEEKLQAAARARAGEALSAAFRVHDFRDDVELVGAGLTS